MSSTDPLYGTRYEVLDVLANGNYGDIYRARDRETHKNCLVKLLQERHLDSKTLDRFRIEAQTAWSLSSPNIMPANDFGVTNAGRPFYVMDDSPGETLAELLDRKGRFSCALAIELVLGLLAGVDAAHEAGVVHRDLCPDNIFIERGPDTCQVKILDFGLAKLRTNQTLIPPSAIPTPDGEVVGKSDYTSPEQEVPGCPADPRMDLYAVGIILYECVVGARPAWKDSSFNIPEELRRVGFPLALGLPDTLQAILIRALSADVDGRFQTARQFSEALHAIS